MSTLIYMVVSGEEGSFVHGLFTDKAKAERASAIFDGRIEALHTDTFEDPFPGLLPFHVNTRNGYVFRINGHGLLGTAFQPLSEGFSPGQFDVWAVNEADAVQRVKDLTA